MGAPILGATGGVHGDPLASTDFGATAAAATRGIIPLIKAAGLTSVANWIPEMHSYYQHLDRSIIEFVHRNLRDRFHINLTGTSTTRGLPLVDSPTPLLLCIIFYLSLVFGGVIRIKFLNLQTRSREPWTLRCIVLAHNLFLFTLSLYMCCGITFEAVSNRYALWGNPYKPQQIQMARLLYIFYISKYAELGDTLIMVAKRSVRQISVLHVYHHCSIAAIWWAIVHHAPGGEAYFSAALNSGVHVAMYGYYFLAAVVGRDEGRRKKYLFWGKYLTQVQMIQFVLNMGQAACNLSKNAPYPRWLNQLLFCYMVSLLILFADFYIRKYVARPRRVGRGKKEV